MNPYTVLGVTENANEAEIKNAFIFANKSKAPKYEDYLKLKNY